HRTDRVHPGHDPRADGRHPLPRRRDDGRGRGDGAGVPRRRHRPRSPAARAPGAPHGAWFRRPPADPSPGRMMDPATLIGLAVSFGGVVILMNMESVHFSAILLPGPVAIVFLGAIGATIA